MTSIPIPILTLNLLDVKIPNNTELMTIFYNGMRALAEENKELFEREDIPIDIFHNDRIAYSGIQFTRYREAASFTAIGEKEVKAIELWYMLFQKSIGNVEQNHQLIGEKYIPCITEKYQNYKTDNILIKKEIADEIALLKSSFAVRDRLEKYLYGNIKAFLVRVAGMEVSTDDFISVKVKRYSKKGMRNTYHGGKLPAYEIDFAVNVYLPQTLRLGQAVSLGYGDIKHA
jgi:hypothetical protein